MQAGFKADRVTVGGRYSDEKKSEVDLYTDFINSLDFLSPYVPGSPTTAPPRYPVSRIAPRMAVRGIR